MDPGVLNLIRFIVATAVFAPFIIIQYKRKIIPKFNKLILFSLISFCLTGFFWCMFEALKYTTALNTGSLFVLIPGIAAIFSLMLLKEKLGKAKILALFLGFFGASWVVFKGEINSFISLELNSGDLIFLVGCFLMAAYAPLVKKVHTGEPSAIITFWTLLTGCFWLAIFSNFQIFEFNWKAIPVNVYLAILYLAIFTTILSTLFFQSAAINLGGNRVAAYTYLNPTLVLLLNWIIGKGLPPIKVIPGVIIVLGATFVLQIGIIIKK